MDRCRRSRAVDESDPAGLAVENFSRPGCRDFFKLFLIHVITHTHDGSTHQHVITHEHDHSTEYF